MANKILTAIAAVIGGIKINSYIAVRGYAYGLNICSKIKLIRIDVHSTANAYFLRC